MSSTRTSPAAGRRKKAPTHTAVDQIAETHSEIDTGPAVFDKLPGKTVRPLDLKINRDSVSLCLEHNANAVSEVSTSKKDRLIDQIIRRVGPLKPTQIRFGMI